MFKHLFFNIYKIRLSQSQAFFLLEILHYNRYNYNSPLKLRVKGTDSHIVH